MLKINIQVMLDFHPYENTSYSELFQKLNELRSVSLLSTVSKLFEKIVCHQMKDYKQNNDLLDPLQKVIRKGQSTQGVLLKVIDDSDILGLFDFTKTFESVSHMPYFF